MRRLPEHVVNAGDSIADHLMSATINKGFGGDLGGCPNFDIDDYPAEYHEYIKAYLTEDMHATEIIYLVMEKAMSETDDGQRNEEIG